MPPSPEDHQAGERVGLRVEMAEESEQSKVASSGIICFYLQTERNTSSSEFS